MGSKRTKILFYTNCLGNGGAEKHLSRLINYLDRTKFQVSLALVRGGGAYMNDLRDDVSIHVLTSKGRSSTLGVIRSFFPLRKLIKKERPDIICSALHFPCVISVLICQSLKRPPRSILLVQGPLRVPCRSLRKFIESRIVLLTCPMYKAADRIVALSRGVATDLLSVLPGIAKKTDVIFNAGCDEMVAAQSIPARRPKGLLIVACGRLTAQKGFSYLIDAFKLVLDRREARLLIIGEGEERLRLEKQIRSLKLERNIELIGFQNNPYRYIASANVFVVSSIWEGFCNVIVEAMCLGIPVVSTDCPYGPSEIITHGHNGILVSPRNPQVMAKAILNVLENEQLGQAISNKGRMRAEDFQASRIAREYEDLFKRISSVT